MTNSTDLTIRTPQIGGDRVIVEAASYKGTKFLQQFGRHMDLVSFGEGPLPHLSVIAYRAVALAEFARAHGLVVERKAA
jgi:hypothetical protein